MADEDAAQDVRDDESDVSPGPAAWKAPTSPEELNAIIEKRIARERKRFADYDSIKEKAARADALELELSSETEKAVRAAREEERARIAAEANPRLVRAEFRAAAKGVLSKEQLDSLLEDLDTSRYVTDKGDVDEERIEKKVSAFAPPKEEKRSFPDLGGGRRGGSTISTNMNQLIREKAGLGQ